MTARNAKSSHELSEDELRLLGKAIDSSPSPLTLYDQDFRLIYSNESSRQTWPELHEAFALGLGLEKAARVAAEALFPGAPAATLEKASRYVVTQFESSEPHDMMAPDGRWMKVSHHRMQDGVIAGVAVNITKLKKREKELEQSKKAQEDLIEVLEAGILVVNKQGFVKSFNSAFSEYCGAFRTEIYKNMPVKELFWQLILNSGYDLGDREFETWFENFYQSRFNKEGTFEQSFSLSDGRHILCNQRYRQHVGNVITVTDITDIKEAQLKAESAERSKSEFLANMSHEIRTPMNGVLGMAHLLSKSNLGENEQQLVSLIERSGKALMTVINDILDFSKIEAGHVTLVESEFDIAESLKDIMALLSLSAAQKNVRLSVKVEPGMMTSLVGDAGRFRQIMTNILGNAVKFTEAGSVKVMVRPANDQGILITVKDTGIGIPSEKMDEIFDKFQQADTGTARKYEGTGLGLSIARKLAKLMGGDIMAESVLGEGSRFDIRLPLKPAKGAKTTISIPLSKAG